MLPHLLSTRLPGSQFAQCLHATIVIQASSQTRASSPLSVACVIRGPSGQSSSASSARRRSVMAADINDVSRRPVWPNSRQSHRRGPVCPPAHYPPPCEEIDVCRDCLDGRSQRPDLLDTLPVVSDMRVSSFDFPSLTFLVRRLFVMQGASCMQC